jgi:hypothetical protein
MLLIVTACSPTYYTNEYIADTDEVGENPMDRTLSALSNMVRTTAQGSAANGLPLGNPVTSLQADKMEPNVYTLQFTVIPPGDGKGFAAYGIVNWKVSGQQITRKVSVFSGSVISGVAEAVDVKIVDVSQIGVPGFPTTPQAYQVGASLSKGSRATTMQPATLVTELQTVSIPAGGSTVFQVPEDAGVISALVTASRAGLALPITPTDIAAVQLTQGSAAVLNTWFPVIQVPGWMPLFGDTVLIGVSNDGAHSALVNVIWGIEG